MRYAVTMSIAALALAFALTGCEDTAVTVPTDGVITMNANPGTVVLDPDNGITTGTSKITAAVFESTGAALQGVSVRFSTSGGALASNGSPVKTDANGLAFDTLTVTTTDPAEITVTAESSSVVQTVTVALQIVGANQQPRATIVDVPQHEQEIGKTVLFDGSASLDPDGQITCYQWTIDSDNDAYDELVQGPAASALQRQYPVEQSLSVVLRVSDSATAGAQCQPGGTPVSQNLFSPFVGTLAYAITCRNTPPVANAGPDLSAIPSTNQLVLDGCASSDSDGVIDRYNWVCGNGQPAVANPSLPCQAFCRYQTPGTFTATLTVFDNGNGAIDPNTGTYACQKQDSDTATVTITAP